MSESLAAWIERQTAYAVPAMLRSVSPLELVKSRPGFGQTVRAARGAIVASPVLASYDPEPDYFFHWYRDSAVVMDALFLLFEEGRVGAQALQMLRDFVDFSTALAALDGRALVAHPQWRAQVAADFRQYLRSDEDLATAHGAAIAGETRVNADGSLDISRWNRPQHDGPPLRALALLRWLQGGRLGADDAQACAALVRSDLDFSAAHWRAPSFDIWEEDFGAHYYTLRVSLAALQQGARWWQAQGDAQVAQQYEAQSGKIVDALDRFWLPDAGHYRSRELPNGERTIKELDIAVILAAIHVPDAAGAHGVHDPRMQQTLARLDALFSRLYRINQHRPATCGTAMGRYEGDVYYAGGAYYFSTLGAAEFCYRAAMGGDGASWMARGDAYLETVRRYTPEDGQLSEQFDQHSGAQASARHLAWSYAAFISCAAARRRACA